jgi:hypothetical protein
MFAMHPLPPTTQKTCYHLYEVNTSAIKEIYNHRPSYYFVLGGVTDVTVRNQLSNIGVSNNILALEFPIIS